MKALIPCCFKKERSVVIRSAICLMIDNQLVVELFSVVTKLQFLSDFEENIPESFVSKESMCNFAPQVECINKINNNIHLI